MMQTTSDNSPIKVALKQKKEAQMWANKNEVQKDNGVNLAAGNQNFVDYFVNWYKTYKEPVLSDSSKLRYRYTISIVMQYFTGRKLNQITRLSTKSF